MMLREEMHVVPSDDDLKHDLQHDCWCSPSLLLDDSGATWTHHADSLLCSWARRVQIRTWKGE